MAREAQKIGKSNIINLLFHKFINCKFYFNLQNARRGFTAKTPMAIELTVARVSGDKRVGLSVASPEQVQTTKMTRRTADSKTRLLTIMRATTAIS